MPNVADFRQRRVYEPFPDESRLPVSRVRDISHGMVTFLRWLGVWGAIASVLGCGSVAYAAPEGRIEAPIEKGLGQWGDAERHAYRASYGAFPSHEFRLAPRWHERPEVSIHFGLLQPVALEGFNAAMDLRWGPLLLSYSHGQGLNYSAHGGLGLDSADKAVELELRSPWTTGGGVGVILVDELWVMFDVKAHRYEATLNDQHAAYTTVSLGGELGYRLFAWRGLFLQSMLRYWPNVYTSLPADELTLGRYTHRAKDLGLFVNFSLGWAFEI